MNASRLCHINRGRRETKRRKNEHEKNWKTEIEFRDLRAAAAPNQHTQHTAHAHLLRWQRHWGLKCVSVWVGTSFFFIFYARFFAGYVNLFGQAQSANRRDELGSNSNRATGRILDKLSTLRGLGLALQDLDINLDLDFSLGSACVSQEFQFTFRFFGGSLIFKDWFFSPYYLFSFMFYCFLFCLSIENIF